MTKNVKNDAQAILELIEDKQYPAKRLLFDYVVGLVANIDFQTSQELNQMGRDFFDKLDKKE